MTQLQTLGGKVGYVRLRGQKVKAGSKLCFAIERETNLPAMTTSTGGLIFSEKGAGLYPVAIIANSYDFIKVALRASKAHFYIDPGSRDLSDSAFRICFKKASFNEMQTLEIHDATKAIIQNVGSFAIGAMPINFGDGAVGEAVEKAWDIVGAKMELKDTLMMKRETPQKVKDAFGLTGKRTDKIGVIVHMYPLKGFVDSGAKSLSCQQMARMLFN